mgnify:CR=1 FL=1
MLRVFLLLAAVAGMVLLTAGFFVAHSVASGWVGRLATQSKGHASSLYLWGYYMGSSVLGAGAGWFWSRWGWTLRGSSSGWQRCLHWPLEAVIRPAICRQN